MQKTYLQKEKNGKEKIKIIIAISAVFIFLAIFILTSGAKQKTLSKQPINNIETSASPPQSQNIENQAEATLLINKKEYKEKIIGTETVFRFMERLEEKGKINFKYRDYAGMGKFIEEINGIKNNGDANWIYYVNGQKAEVGVSNYEIKGGDVVSWQYEKGLN